MIDGYVFAGICVLIAAAFFFAGVLYGVQEKRRADSMGMSNPRAMTRAEIDQAINEAWPEHPTDKGPAVTIAEMDQAPTWPPGPKGSDVKRRSYQG